MKTDTEISNITKVAIQGYEGSFHHVAANMLFGSAIEIIPSNSFTNLFSRMASDANLSEALIAIENSIAGSILQNYKLLRESELFIVGEIYLQIQQNLLVIPGTPLREVEEVHSHPMALLQCDEFFENHPNIRLLESEDTALSAKEVQQKGITNRGAIASQLAAKLYGLEMVAEGIETVKNNFTRFLWLTRNPVYSVNSNKASIHFRISNDPGALLRALEVINKFGINISKIQSVPEILREWRYYFHLDLEFDERDLLEKTMEELKSKTEDLRVFGIYEKGKTICSQ